MSTLEAIETRIKRLQEQAEAIKAKKASATLDRIVELMQTSEVTVADIEAHLGGKKRGAKSGKKTVASTSTVTAKYQDPETGATWSGRGRAPTWIADAKNRDRFLVDGNASKASASVASKAKTRGTYVRGAQPAMYSNPKTGATWSGRGRAPAWIANAKNRDRFLVDGNVATASPRAGSGAKRHGNYARGPQPAKYRDPESGATWSGRGPAPAWLANAKDRAHFLIEATV
jgi:DNA-binding protein H-NS